MRTAWATYAPQTPLPRPSPEAARRLIALPIDVHSGQRLDSRSSAAATSASTAAAPMAAAAT